jgi:fatty-acyl-CoA synthase
LRRRAFTFAEFGARAQRWRRDCADWAFEAGDRLAFLSFNTHKLLESYYGVVQARAIVMPINVRLSPEEIGVILRHSGARFLFFEPEFAPLVAALRSGMSGG